METQCKIVYDPPRYMTVAEAANQMIYVEEEVRQADVLSRTTMCVALARVGQDDQKIVSGTLEEMLTIDMG
eukprot:CAMPEP_0184042132 /NCGR_PEP_ID=MMETSP0955-20130417/65744_1 /TAXON_ID=627963 /ORGANISM="Aplanochytrium sp, Strain PBS07" /LENGTH=70 /DNA_ID=CAMNT_0026332799 /DNA_START=57 /DNA_END=265 /DNA_ORIENTATION=-